MATLKKLSKHEYYPSVKIEAWRHKSKSVVVDGETYSKDWQEPYEFDTDIEINNRLTDNNWCKIVYELIWLGHYNIILWNYYGFYDRPLMREIAYDDMKSTPNIVRMYKENKNIFNSKIISKIGIAGRNWQSPYVDIHDIENSILNYNSIPFEIGYAAVHVRIKHLLMLPIYKFPEEYKRYIKFKFVDDRPFQQEIFKLPEKILNYQLTEFEINQILLDFLKSKIKLKRKKL